VALGVAATVAAVAALNALAVLGVVTLTEGQTTAVLTAVDAAVALAALLLWGRGAVTPVADPHDAAGTPLVAVDSTEARWEQEDLPEGVEVLADDEVPVAEDDD
jgi:hypothetical protein